MKNYVKETMNTLQELASKSSSNHKKKTKKKNYHVAFVNDTENSVKEIPNRDDLKEQSITELWYTKKDGIQQRRIETLLLMRTGEHTAEELEMLGYCTRGLESTAIGSTNATKGLTTSLDSHAKSGSGTSGMSLLQRLERRQEWIDLILDEWIMSSDNEDGIDSSIRSTLSISDRRLNHHVSKRYTHLCKPFVDEAVHRGRLDEFSALEVYQEAIAKHSLLFSLEECRSVISTLQQQKQQQRKTRKFSFPKAGSFSGSKSSLKTTPSSPPSKSKAISSSPSTPFKKFTMFSTHSKTRTERT